MDPAPFQRDRSQLVPPVRIDPTGLNGPTRAQARGNNWRRTSQGFYVPADTPRTLDQRIVEAAAVLPPAAAVTGWAALRWCGGTWFDGTTTNGRATLPVTLASCQDDIRPQPGIELSQERLDPADIIAVDGLRVTVPVRSVCFEMRYAENLCEATVCLDMAAYSDLVSIEEAAAYAYAHPGWTGIPQARQALPLADENCWSPQEARMVYVWVAVAGLTAPLCNRPIFDRWGRHIGTPDLFDPVAAVAGEYDGALHLSGARRSHDLQREGLFRKHGLEYFTVLVDDMRQQDVVVDRMVETRERGLRLAKARTSWTLTPPPWWIESHRVDQRRALTGATREVVLRHRRRVA